MKIDPFNDNEQMIPGTEISVDDRFILQRVLLFSPEGKQALKWLLNNLGLYREIRSEGDSARHSFALRILNTLGLLENANSDKVIDSLAELAQKDALRPGHFYSIDKGRSNVRPTKP
jgi:hypothetical protein